jgi:hypothetical protein
MVRADTIRRDRVLTGGALEIRDAGRGCDGRRTWCGANRRSKPTDRDFVIPQDDAGQDFLLDDVVDTASWWVSLI